MELIEERGRTHGVFAQGAVKALELQAATVPGEQETAVAMFARQMICAKLARIVCGDPQFEDHWRDIAGYATLVANDIADRQKA